MTRSWAADARPPIYAEGRQRPMVSWSEVKIIALLSHLESNKGLQGLYMKDQSTAFKEAQAAVAEVTPPGETFAEPRHIAAKHYRLLVKYTPEEETRSTKELYIHGCAHLTLLPEKLRPERLPRQTSAASPVDDPLADVEMPDYATQQAIAVEIVGPRTSTLTPYYGGDAKFPNIGLPENKVNEGEVALSSTSSRDLPAVSGETLNDHLGERTEYAQRFESIPSTTGTSPESQIAPQLTLYAREETIRQRCIDLLETDDERENPTAMHASGEIEKIYEKINLVARDYLLFTGVDEKTPLNLRAVDFAIGGKDFLTAAQRMFRYPTDSDIIDKVSDHQTVAFLSLYNFLRSFIAATIMEKVFLGWTSDFEATNYRSSYVEGYLSNMDWELTRRILLVCRRQFLKDIRSPKIRSEAEILARELNSSLRSFTARPASQTRQPSTSCAPHHGKSGSWAHNWRESLENIFQLSLRLRMSFALSSIEYEYRWPRSNMTFDIEWMKTEEGGRPKGGPRKVYLSLMPAIIPRDRKKDGERPLSKAIVILFPLE